MRSHAVFVTLLALAGCHLLGGYPDFRFDATGEAGSTGDGGSAGQGGGVACTSPDQCPGQDSDCGQRTCEQSLCGFAHTPAGTACGEADDACDGNGNCVTPCANSAQCTSGEICRNEVCTKASVWSRSFGNNGSQRSSSVAVDSNSNVLLVGTLEDAMQVGDTTLQPSQEREVYAIKLDQQGTVSWAKVFGGGTKVRTAATAVVDANGEIIIAGYFDGSIGFGGELFTTNGKDAFVAKLDADGAHKWSTHIKGGDFQLVTALAVDKANSIYLAGEFKGTMKIAGFGATSSTHAGFVARLAPDGSILTPPRVIEATTDVFLNRLAHDGADGVYAVGYFSETVDFFGQGTLDKPPTTNALFLAKLSSSLDFQWANAHPTQGVVAPGRIAADSSGVWLVGTLAAGDVNFGGETLSSPGGMGDAIIAKIGPNGTHAHSALYGDSDADSIAAVALDSQGNALIVGSFGGTLDLGGGVLTGVGPHGLFAAKLDAAGGHLWSASFGKAIEVAPTHAVFDGLFPIVTGSFEGGALELGGNPLPSHADSDVFVAKLQP